ncbi:MAG TPA: cytochrome c biogenesis protein ResB [bacterium]|nr:cytochrome c biogenesis protein ResB [bacterium]
MNVFKENKILKFLGSVQMALPMILILAVLLATGTIVESRYSTLVAKRFVYGTWWFAAFLILLGVNLLCSALSRFPWKKYQTGFVITHLGIICVLAGSLVTQQMGSDGQIALNEGEEGHVFQEDKPTLYYQIADGAIEQFPAAFNFRPPNPDHPLIFSMPEGGTIMVDQFYLNAQKKVSGRKTDEGEKGYPAIHLDLASSFVHENQWLFLGHPDYGHLDLGPASVFFEKESDWKKRLARGARDVSDNALAVLLASDGSLKFQARHRGEFAPIQALKVGEEYSTGWMDMQVKVSERLSEALPEENFTEQPLPHQKDPEPAIHYQVNRITEHKEGWLAYQSEAKFQLSGKPFGLAYGPRQFSLPFTLHLVKFKLGLDPGTDKPASYASDILYTDEEKGSQVPAEISMNKPLHWKGYTIYQASYQPMPDGKYVSVFAVGKDPGIWLKYGGALVLVFGIILMFWFKNPNWGKKEVNA